MPININSDPTSFAEIETFAKRFDAAGRSGSVALLLWFLQTVYRLDEVEAQDAVCDSPGDAGFDAVAADDLRREIIVFQSKRRDKLPATLGENDLKHLVGSLAQLSSKASVEKLIATTKNNDLKKLLVELDVAEKIGSGYSVRAIFVTNVAASSAAREYLLHTGDSGSNVDLWDLVRLRPVLDQLQRDWFVPDTVTLRVNPDRLFKVGTTPQSPELIYAAVRARQLVHLPGIDDSRLFAQNVRLGLGSTRVNDDLLETVQNRKEHPDFLTFHNGLTIVSKSIELAGNDLKLRDFSVCNGCQSLLTFYNNRAVLTEALEVLVRVVKVGDDRRLPEKIAYRTNNQNSISLRDLSSNDVTQVRLKAQFDGLFSKFSEYGIKRGETDSGKELPNEFAGRLLLALFLQEPWAAHQKYRVFGDLESRIFSYSVDAAQIRLAQLLFDQIGPQLVALENQRLARYGLTSFLILYLLGEVFRTSEDGRALLNDPNAVLTTNKKANPKQKKLLVQSKNLIAWLVTELNFLVKDGGGEAYDYKRAFKSQKLVHGIRDEILKAFEKDILRKRVSRVSAP